MPSKRNGRLFPSTVTVRASQRWMALVWYLMVLPFLTALIAQTMGGAFDNRDTEMWGWALPTFMPTLALITGVVVVEEVRAQGKNRRTRTVPIFAQNVTLGLSVFYLLLLNYVVFSSRANGYSIQALQRSNVFLGSIQAIVGLALAVFFGSASDVTTANKSPVEGNK
jgi:uncharacterized membrane protein YeiB